MSSFKQRLGNALNQKINNAGATSPYAHDSSLGNVYSSGGYGSTARKSFNAINTSKMSGTTSNNVLTDRVSRISEKINEIHVLSTLSPCLTKLYSQILRKESWESWTNTRGKPRPLKKSLMKPLTPVRRNLILLTTK